MSFTTMVTLNAVLSVLVVGALFRLMWFGISKPYDEPSLHGERESRREIREGERARRAA